ncbi:OB-fold-containig protein [Serratia sp. D1N4]
MFFLMPENVIFLVSFALVFVIGLVEILAIICGMSLFAHVDALFPSDIDASDSIFAQGLDWLNRGRVPFLILSVLFLSCFAIAGFVIQWLSLTVAHSLLPGSLVALPSIVFTIFMVKKASGLLAKIIPPNETSAISEDLFIGCMAVIVGGTASTNSPAQCRLVDKFNQTHYLLVQPEKEDETFLAGDKILITARLSSSLFQGMKNPWPEHL